MPGRYFGREIKVTTGGDIRTPVSFKIGDREYIIAEILESWPDYGFGRSDRRKRWWMRHHRNYFRVKTTEGEVYEMYYDRGVNLKNAEFKRWFLTQRL